MKINKSLDEILGNQKRVEILRTLFQYPGSYSGSHIARLCNLPQKTVQRHLDVLESNNVLNVQYIGKSKVFSLNKKNILYNHLQKIFRAEKDILTAHQNLIKNTIEQSNYLRNNLAHASIYGSVVEGKERSQSDIDLFLLFKKPFDENLIEEQLQKATDTIVTISGTHLHWFAKNLQNYNQTNKQILSKIKNHSKLIYGEKLEDIAVGKKK